MIALLLLLFSSPAFAQEPTCDHKVIERIIALQSPLNPALAHDLCTAITAASEKYKVNPFVMVAIAKQESGLRQVNRTQLVYLKNKKKYVKAVTDVGIFQFHVHTIKRLGLDIERLETDVAYQVEQHALLLRSKMRICRYQGLAKNKEWGCYHSFTPSHYSIYIKQVERWLPETK